MTLTKNKDIPSKPRKKPTSKKQKAVTVKPKKASLAAQRAWAVLTPAQKVKLKKRFNKDPDRDGVPTGFDCQPLNKKKQESFLPDDAAYIKRHSSFMPSPKIIGEGTNGIIVPLKSNKNFVVKVGKSDAWNPINKEGAFYKRHNLSKEPLFIPTKTIKIDGKLGSTRLKSTGLLRPIVTPLVEPEYHLHKSTVKTLTDAKLKDLKAKLIQLSYKGFIFSDGLQLAIDRKGRLLQFDVGAVTKYPVSVRSISNIPFKQNNIEWKRLLNALNKSTKDLGQITRLPEMDKKYLAQRRASIKASKAEPKTSSKPKSKAQSKTVAAPNMSARLGEAKIFIDPKFLFHPKHKEIYQKVKKALKDFPEIKEVKLSAFYPKSGNNLKGNAKWETPDVMAIAGFGGMIEFNMKRVPSYNVIYHELYHVIQGKRKSTKAKSTTTFEKEATLFGMARLPKSRVETNEMPYMPRSTVPKSKLTGYGKQAQTEKGKGNKDYLKKVENKMSEDYKKDENRKSRKGQWERIGRDAPDPKHHIKFNVVRNGKNYAKNFTYSKVHNELKANIRKSQQAITSRLIRSYDPHKCYAYEKADLIKIPNWMKSKPKRSSKSKK